MNKRYEIDESIIREKDFYRFTDLMTIPIGSIWLSTKLFRFPFESIGSILITLR